KSRESGKDPATRTFQAIRIHINQELAELEVGLDAAFAHLAPHGRMVVISFHSLEDRMVKRFIAAKAHVAQPDRRLPLMARDLPQPQMKLIRKSKPSMQEVAENPRARSAIMRIGERLPEREAA
ncbi:MAG: mraW, partial [Burkholderiaceae bacterium]|nr:mraW [Burkholderiaceae bacterium]